MHIHQISVFLENRTGQLAEITQLLAQQNIDIRAISIAETTDYGVARMIVNDYQKASAILLEHGDILSQTAVWAVEVPDRPAGLSELLAVLAEKAEKAALADVLKPRHGVRAPVAPAAAAVMAAPVAAAAADVAASQSVSQASDCPAAPLKIKIPSNIPTEMPPMLQDNPAVAEIHPPVKMPSECPVNPVTLVSFTLSSDRL